MTKSWNYDIIAKKSLQVEFGQPDDSSYIKMIFALLTKLIVGQV